MISGLRSGFWIQLSDGPRRLSQPYWQTSLWNMEARAAYLYNLLSLDPT